ncbi:serine/arginine-rich splicing factor 4 [Zeugodacus cucurbitae]|uniref:serine/arginine-rich splicing factor 4 n=1 Tax=Zeugodacus cucurbitae TaxID=28588 RepID=UPI000596977F|nr:serine/arginine-rich splicing factor 4 [Zeugodacus cucurbitae]
MEAVMIDPEAACCSHEPATDKSKRSGKEQKLLQKAVKKAYKAQKLLNEAIKRLEASNEKQKKKHKQSKHLDSSSTSSSTSSSSSSSSSSGTSSSSSSSDTDGEAFIDLTNEVGKPSKRHHGRKHYHERRNRRGRDRSRSRSHSRGRSRGHSRGHSRGRSRGHSRGHSKTRDLELRQLSQFFRGASLQTAPPILHGHQQPPHHRHMRSHIRPAVIGGGGRRSRSHSHDHRNKGDHKKKRKHKKHKSAKEQAKHGAAGSGKEAHAHHVYSNLPYYWCSHSGDRPHIARNECHRYGDEYAGRPSTGRPYNSVFSDIREPAFMQQRGEVEGLRGRMMPVYYDAVPNYRRRAHSEPRH